jgi:hypothetical protein
MTDSEGNNRAEEAALWQRFRTLEQESGMKVKDLGDPLTLAAYAEGRLGTKAVEAVEAFLAAKPEIIGDILAARAAVQATAPVASEAVISGPRCARRALPSCPGANLGLARHFVPPRHRSESGHHRPGRLRAR